MRSHSNTGEQVTDVTSSAQGSRKAPSDTASCTRASQHTGGQLPGRFEDFCLLRAQRQMLSSHCAAPCQHRPQQQHACTCSTYLVSFFPPFLKPTTKTKFIFSKHWIESVKAHFLQGNISAITNSSSWKPPCLSFSVQKGLHKSAALQLGCLCLLLSVNLQEN